MSIDAKIKELYKLHKSSGLYSDSFENVIFKLTNAYDYSFLELSRNARKGQPSPNPQDYEDFDRLRQAYRACVKFVYEDCKRGNFNQHISLSEIRDFQKEMKETIQFNFIRNVVDRYKLNRFRAFEDGDILKFENVESDRSFIYDAYTRNIADSIPGAKNERDTVDTFDFTSKIIEIAKNKPEFQSKKIFKPAKHELIKLIGELAIYYLRDLDIEIGNIQGKDYFLGDYLLVYCYLVAIGIYKTAYLVSLRYDNDQVYQPSIVYPKERLIKDIADTTGMSIEVVEKVISDMVYDYEFHKNRLTIYQPLFEIGDSVLCSVNLISHAYVIDKIMKYYDVKGTNKKDLALYHRYRANKMNHRMAYYLPLMYENLQTFENCELTINGITKSEIDLIVFDEKTKTAALVELKNYTPVDNEEDAVIKENRINNAIESRVARDKLVIDNIDLFLEQNEIPSRFSQYKYYSFLVTNEPIGGVGIKELIKVIDESLFYNLLSIYNGDLLAVINSINTGEFFKTLESSISMKNMEYDYKGLKVEIIYK